MNDDLQALLDACVDAVVIIDHRGAIETFNQSACRMYGYPAADVIGRDVIARRRWRSAASAGAYRRASWAFCMT